MLAVVVALGCQPAPPPPPTPTPVSVLGAAERKVDSILLDLLLNYQLRGAEGAEDYARNRGLLTRDNHVRVTLVLHSADDVASVRERVQGMGARVTGTWENYVDVRVPLQTLLSYANDRTRADFLRDLADLTAVRDIQEMTDPVRDEPLRGPTRDCMSLVEQATRDRSGSAEGADRIGASAWHRAGLTGRGVKVGIIDSGFFGYRELLGRTLPANVVTRAFSSDGAFLDDDAEERHGAGVAEIVHAVAPEAELYLAHIDGSVANLGSALDWLIDEAKVSIVSLSAGWPALSRGDHSGPFARAADIVRERGVLFVAATGNDANKYYSAESAPRGGYHEFTPGKDYLEVRTFGRGIAVFLNWYDWVDRDTDFHLILADANNQEVASSRNQGRDKVPVQQLRYQAAERDQTYFVRIRAIGGTRPVRLRLWVRGADMERVTPPSSVATPGDLRSVLGVGATYWNDDSLLCYSSRGPTLDNRVKPDLSAPSHVTTLTYRDEPRGFTGTSASTPHVAGAAALVLGANPGATVDQLIDYLQREALPLEQPIPANGTGYGRLTLGDPGRARGLR